MVTLIRAASGDIKNACFPHMHPGLSSGRRAVLRQETRGCFIPAARQFFFFIFYLHSLIKKDNEVSENGS